MDIYQRAWASLLQRIEAKTSWGRNELKQQMLEALVSSQPFLCPLCGNKSRTGKPHLLCANQEQARADILVAPVLDIHSEDLGDV